MIEAMKQMVEAFEIAANGGGVDFYAYAKAGRQAIAEAEKQVMPTYSEHHNFNQEPFEDLSAELFVVAQVSPADDGFSETIERIESWLRKHFTHPPQLEQNFCPRCGKRTNDIHTCTPPKDKA